MKELLVQIAILTIASVLAKIIAQKIEEEYLKNVSG